MTTSESLAPPTRCAIWSPKGRKFRGEVTVQSVDPEMKTVAFTTELPVGTKAGDRLVWS